MNRFKVFIGENSEKIILLIAILLSLISFFYYYSHGLTLVYGDARGHLNIARRVFDNLTPGLAQLGGVWLPLFHVLMLPTIWNSFMWHSGLSGSIVSMPMYVIASYYIYKLTYLITNNKLSALIAFLVFALNVNLLYLQSTPMTEALFLGTLVPSVYVLILWVKTQKLSYLLISAFGFLLTSFNRYEGWPVIIVAIIIVFFVSLFKKGREEAEGSVILFSSLASLGVILWLIWQTTIFHNTFYFLNSEFSAKAQTDVSIALGQVPTYKNFIVSFEAFYFSLSHTLGEVVLIAAIISLIFLIIICIFNRKKINISIYIAIMLFMVPGLFLIYALYKGNIPINVPEISNNNQAPLFFNVRYALYSLPAVSIIIGYISKYNKIVYTILFIAVVSNAIILLPLNGKQIDTLVDATKANLEEVNQTYSLIRNNYNGGLILASAATSDPIIFGTGLNMSKFITEGSGKYWTASLKDPSIYAEWIILTDSQRDMVNIHVNKKILEQNFISITNNTSYRIYKKKSN